MSGPTVYHKPAFAEGMPIVVQTFQQWDRWHEFVQGFHYRHGIASFGVVRLVLNDELARDRLTIATCIARLPDGNSVEITQDGEGDRCLPATEIGRRMPGDGTAVVHIVLPERMTTSPSAYGGYRREPQRDVKDDFGEASSETIQVLKKNLRLEITFGNQALDPRLIGLPVAMIERTNGKLRLRSDFAPPCLCISAFMGCCLPLHERLRALQGRCAEHARSLHSDIGAVVQDSTRPLDAQTVRKLWVLQVLGAHSHIIQDFFDAPAAYPGDLYRELACLAVELGGLRADAPLHFDSYDPYRAYPLFEGVCRRIHELLDRQEQRLFIEAESFTNLEEKGTWKFEFKDDELLREGTLYLGVKREPSVPEDIFLDRTEAMSVRDKDAKKGWKTGVDRIPLTKVIPLSHMPQLPVVRKGYDYRRIETEEPAAEKMWEAILRTRTLSVYVHELNVKVHLFAVRREEAP